ncbi:hypothetical protein COOONC_06424 [Cooperia oncophora]
MVKHHVFYTFSREAINFLAIINSSINFVIYIVFGKEFRKELIIVYGCGIRSITMRLPTHDKFSIWRTWGKRATAAAKGLRGSISAGGRSNSSTHGLSKTPNLEYSSLDHLEQTRFINDVKDMNGKLTRTEGSPIRIIQNGSAKSVQVEPINGTAGRRTTLTLMYPIADNEMNGQVVFLPDGEGTLC